MGTGIPLRAVTRGPQNHWFGYYDKLQFDPSGRQLLSMEADFEGRSPGPDDTIRVGVIDLQQDCHWRELGSTRSWCWQQGCMLQWRPGSDREVLWNDRQGDRYVCHVLDTVSGSRRTLDRAVYTVAPDGRTAVSADFRRINHMRPGYGYAGIDDPNHDMLAPDDVGVWRVDMESGAAELIITIAQVAAIPYAGGDLSGARHYFNHLLLNTDGSRFIFLHRWRFGDGGFHTRMMTAALDGSDIRCVDPHGNTSHFIWRDPQHILAWSWHPSKEWQFYLYDDRVADAETVEAVGEGVMTVNGHCTYLADPDWILNDTYPMGDDRLQELYLYHVPSRRRFDLTALAAPRDYQGEWRCDLHPRSSPDGRLITVDSAHADGRQIYMLDAAEVIASVG
jgi:hypothetical protein